MASTVDLRSLLLRAGEQHRDTYPVELEALQLGGQTYRPTPPVVPAIVTVTQATSGLVFRLQLETTLRGPCFRCLEDAELVIQIDGTEYEDADPEELEAGDDEDLTTTYLADELLDIKAWAHDAIALAVPDKILCRDECAGLCPQCGTDLNDGACDCGPPPPDSRWQQLEALREQLAD